MLVSAGYTSIASTTDPTEVCEGHREHHYDLILLDLMMPHLDGFQVMERLKKIEPEGYLPVLVITAQPEHKLRALRAGAKDFISKPFELAEVLARVRNMLEVRLLHKKLHDYNEALEQRVRERTADLQTSYLETIFTLTRAAEYKDEDTGAHVQRISYYSRNLARMLSLNEAFADEMFFSSPMHDIGKIGIPDHILLKPGSLTRDEIEVMKGHAAIGASILGNSKSLYLETAAEIALNHHERWDGGGYPNGKRGEAIPLTARIMNICDIYDALRSKRPYKPAFDHMKSIDIITHGDGRTQPEHFDPSILAAFEENHHSFRDVYEKTTA
jgi:putative two-component system response regulator